MTSVLFVCLGNICRSPLAEGIFRRKVQDAGRSDQILIDSAGTGAWHAGNPPDPRSIEIAAAHGIDISSQRARQVTSSDYDRFDYLVAMDADNLANLLSGKGKQHQGIRLLLTNPPADVPDPYYGGPKGFEEVYRLVDGGCDALLTSIRQSR